MNHTLKKLSNEVSKNKLEGWRFTAVNRKSVRNTIITVRVISKFKVNFILLILKKAEPEFDQFWRHGIDTSFLESKVSKDCAAS